MSEVKIPEGYKQTEVGVIPEDWKITPLGEIVQENRISSGLYKDKNSYGSGTSIIKLGDVFSNDIFNPNSVQKVEADEAEIQRYKIKVGDLIIALASVKLEGVGKVMHVTTLEDETIFDHNVALIRTTESINSYFLSYTFKSNYIRSMIASKATQVGTTFLKSSTILQFNIILPTYKEQTAIATALSDVDDLIGSLEKLITKKEAIKTATMQQLLSGKTRLPEFAIRDDGIAKGFKQTELGWIPEDWEVVQMGDIGKFGRGRVISNREIDRSITDSYPVYSSQTSNDGIMGYIDTFDFEGEYITWTTDGVNAGKVFYRNGKFNCTNVCGSIKVYNQNTNFIALAMSIRARKYVSTNLANPKLMNGVAKKVLISTPTLIEEQTAIATILSDMDSEIQALQKRLDKTRDIKQGMMQQLLTGKVRLVSSTNKGV